MSLYSIATDYNGPLEASHAHIANDSYLSSNGVLLASLQWTSLFFYSLLHSFQECSCPVEKVRTLVGLYLIKPLELEYSFNTPQNLIRFEQRLNVKKERPILDMLGYQSNAEIETMQ